MASGGLFPLWAPLLFQVLLGGEDPSAPPRVPTSAPAARDAPRAAAAPLGRGFPARSEWGFETTDERGREIYAMEEVPLFLGDRPTQPDWVQDFGARADPARRDRFPREPAAAFSSRESAKGRRSLHLMSRGDSARVRLSRPVPAAGGLSLRLSALVKLRGLREGTLRLQVRPSGGASPLVGPVLESRRLSGDQDWTKLELSGQVPDGTESLMAAILLEGSYRDGEAHAWVDSMELELSPGLDIEFGGRKLLLFGASDREIPFRFEARGVPPGAYEVEGRLERIGGSGPFPGEAPLVFRASRYATEPDSSGPSAAASSLRLLGDLRQLFHGAPLPPGPLQLSLGLTSMAGEPMGGRAERIGVLPGPDETVSTRGLRLGIAFTPAELTKGDLETLAGLPAGFPVAELLWDIASGARTGEVPALPPEVRLAGQRTPLPWRGRFGPDLLRDPRAPSLLQGWSHRIRSWEAAVGPGDQESGEAIRRIREGSDLGSSISLGSPGPGARPPWSSFQVFEAAGAPAGSPEVQDWTIVAAPRAASEREEFLGLARLVLDLARTGHRRVFVRGAIDLLGGPSGAGRRPPRLAAFAWAGLGRLLAQGPVREDYSWDPRATFLAIPDGVGLALVTLSRGAEGFRRTLWTGGPLRGEDLFGNRVSSTFDEVTGMSEVPVGPEPVVWRGFDHGLLATVESLAETGPGLRLRGADQEVQFRVKNRGEKPLSLGLALGLPEGFRPVPASGPREVAPGAEATFRFPVAVPEGFAGSQVRASLRLSIDGPDRKCAFVDERRLAVGSESLRLLGEEFDTDRRKLTFAVESAAARPLSVRLWCRVLLSGGEDLQESWDERVPPLARRAVSLDLDLPASALEGKEVLIGAEVRGGGERLSGRYHLKRAGGQVRLVAD